MENGAEKFCTEKAYDWLRRACGDPQDSHIKTATTLMDDSTKRGGQPTSELFTEILCSPNFVVSPCLKPKFIGYAIPKINMLHNLSCCETRFKLLYC